MGYAYGRGHGRGKPSKLPKPPIMPPIMPPIVPPTVPQPPYVPLQPKPVRRTNKIRFITRGVQGIRYRKAEHGFHGIVDSPTRFLVGENGAEHIDIRPMKSMKMKKKGSNNDYDFFASYNNLMGGFK